MFIRTLVTNVQLVFDHQSDIAINASVYIEIARGHRRDSAKFIIATIGYLHAEYIFSIEFHIRRNIEIKAGVTTFVVSQKNTIDVNFAIFLDTIKFQKNFF